MPNPIRRILLALALVAPAWAQAQVLDFDSVCASPPCAAGSLYAASGIAISPAGTNVVAAGTNGLTGVNGGKYLSMAAFPYQVSFGLSRNATFFSASMARASTASGPVTVAVTALRAGLVVAGPINVVLTTFAIWSPVSLSVPGGIDQVFIDPSGGANLTFGIDNVQFAGNCFGFADVLTTDSFCSAAEYLGNRGITIGCAAGLYCPTANVTRAQMALFMSRLAAVVSPTILTAFGHIDGTYASFPTIGSCVVTLPAANFPRSAVAISSLLNYNASASKRVMLQSQYSTDGGATWPAMPGFYMGHTILPGNFSTVVAPSAALNLAAGVTYMFASGAGAIDTAPTVSGDCTLRVDVFNQSPISAPFDAPAVPQQRLP